jgi:hypothetical protein
MKIADWLTDSKGRIVYWVSCCKCDASVPESYNPEKAIALWNRQFDKQVIEVYRAVINHLRFHNGEFAAGRLEGNGLSVAIMNELALLNLTGIPKDSNGGQNK